MSLSRFFILNKTKLKRVLYLCCCQNVLKTSRKNLVTHLSNIYRDEANIKIKLHTKITQGNSRAPGVLFGIHDVLLCFLVCLLFRGDVSVLLYFDLLIGCSGIFHRYEIFREITRKRTSQYQIISYKIYFNSYFLQIQPGTQKKVIEKEHPLAINIEMGNIKYIIFG